MHGSSAGICILAIVFSNLPLPKAIVNTYLFTTAAFTVFDGLGSLGIPDPRLSSAALDLPIQELHHPMRAGGNLGVVGGNDQGGLAFDA